MDAAPARLDRFAGRARGSRSAAGERAGPTFRLYSGSAERLTADGAGLIVTPNLDHLRLLTHCKALRRAYRQADVILNDSRFLDRLALRGGALCLPGSELAPAMLSAAPAGSRVVLIGGDDAVQAYLRDAYPELVVSVLRPSMGYVRRRGERRRIVDAVLAAAPERVFVCTGAPQSELLAAQLKRAGCQATILCCGSAFRFLTGAERRAPAALRRIGAEWLWRFVREGRTRARYAADAAFLLARLPAFMALRHSGQGGFGRFSLRVR